MIACTALWYNLSLLAGITSHKEAVSVAVVEPESVFAISVKCQLDIMTHKYLTAKPNPYPNS